tara:strand:+ start:399 stop:1115 length:717 start_codon:yes stop_codon:yes gene_type:complete
MNVNLKLVIGAIYLSIISVGLYFLFSLIDVKDLMSYEFIRTNKDLIIKYKIENFLLLTSLFFIFSVIWVLLLGFAMPLLLFSGFVFGKWWGIIIVLTATTTGATLLYLLVGYFFRDTIKEKLEPKFSKLSSFFIKNDILYFTSFRFIGGGGMPYAVQNVLPLLFNMPVKNYVIATYIGSLPSMFVSVALGSGIENVIDKNTELTASKVLFSPEIYIPIIAFFIILIIAFLIKKFYFKT